MNKLVINDLYFYLCVQVGIFAQEIFTPLKKEAKVKKMNVHVDKTSFVTTSTTPGLLGVLSFFVDVQVLLRV